MRESICKNREPREGFCQMRSKLVELCTGGPLEKPWAMRLERLAAARMRKV